MAQNNTIRGLTARNAFKLLATTFRTKCKPKDLVVVAGKSRTAESLASEFEGYDSHFVQVDRASASYHQAITDRGEALPGPMKSARAALTGLEVHWGDEPQKLVEAHIPLRKQPRELTAKEKVAAAEKRQITRTMRGTRGARQKANIKAEGQIAVTTTQVTGANASSSAATPAASAVNQAVPAANGANPVAPAASGTTPASSN